MLLRSAEITNSVTTAELQFFGGMIWVFHLISGKRTFISVAEVLSASGKKFVQLCHSIFGLNENPAKPCGSPNCGVFSELVAGFPTMVFRILARWRAAKYCKGGIPKILNSCKRNIFSLALTNPKIPAAALVSGVCFTLSGFTRAKVRLPSFTKTILPIAPLRLPFFFRFAITINFGVRLVFLSSQY